MEIEIKRTAETREELEWVIGHLFGALALQYIDRDLLQWFNGLQRPTAHELRELVGGMDFNSYFEMASDCKVDLPYFVCPENFSRTMMQGFRGVLSSEFDTGLEGQDKRRLGII